MLWQANTGTELFLMIGLFQLKCFIFVQLAQKISNFLLVNIFYFPLCLSTILILLLTLMILF